MKIDTKLIHGSHLIDEQTGAVSVPIYQVSTYKQDEVGKHRGYEYSRTGNPTRQALEDYIAALENGARGLAFSSGMSATGTILSLFEQGDHIICSDDVYGGTFRIMDKVFKRFGITVSYVNTSDIAEVESAFQTNTKALFVETPTNPLLKVSDVSSLSRVAKSKNALFIVDNTFYTPYWQNPLDLGADIVVHSATKYLGGHSDVVAGLIVTKEAELGDQLHFYQNAIGGVLGPQDSWLLMRGMKTLGLRMKQHEFGANKIADWLTTKVDKVYYPGLESHPNHAIAKMQARGFGGMISFDVGDGQKAAKALTKVKYFTLAESLGAVESLISIPAKMTHASIPAETRAKLGITDGLIRISVGIEDVEDLIHDLDRAIFA
ncbi:bifunctional cystathionine gamma-lyase/homocysteine desulfhydrase [Shimazuella kribbensis]|uniref:bifunctional cystathionine gamma-lyase/homocysteine desulfhydrase n=1 Tax=Shimazuella kribbensis TaxID=139808 RepID=UPI0003FA1AB5|nr:bifunctional cystathionine gamma-lyase/homocysteine desulfhydrase [Shimazuella kribbensis]